MPDDAVDRVLRLVERRAADGRGGRPDPRCPGCPGAGPSRPAAGSAAEPSAGDSPARALRVEITERGRTVINLRVPLSLGRAAINRVPGISELTSERIREAIAAGIKGPIIDIDDEGDRVQISIE